MMSNVLELCQNMKIPIESFSIRMEGLRDVNPSRISEINAIIDLNGDVPEERRATLMRVAKGCRIHNTLTRPPKIEVSLSVNEVKSA